MGGCATWLTIYTYFSHRVTSAQVHISVIWNTNAPDSGLLVTTDWDVRGGKWWSSIERQIRADTRWHAGTRGTWPLLGLPLWCQLKVLKRINFFLWLPKCIWQTFSWVQLAKIDEESTSKWGLYTYHISSWAAALLLASRGDTPSCHTPRSSASLNGRQGNDRMDLNILCDI